jgi:hypothetical protein
LQAAWIAALELHVEAQRRHKDGAAIPVVSRIVDVLPPQRRIYSAPDVERVIGLDNIFAAVIQAAITQKKTRSAQRQIFLVVA